MAKDRFQRKRHKKDKVPNVGYGEDQRPPGLMDDGTFLLPSGTRGKFFVDDRHRILHIDDRTGTLVVDDTDEGE
ncbi:MAG: hypothetical protein KBD50_03735 [Candidatus Pacebacteria bacterium]|nr:hypothetical protein [Candidatus Paceibacterota bacterium]